jgi:hypothetical protein
LPPPLGPALALAVALRGAATTLGALAAAGAASGAGAAAGVARCTAPLRISAPVVGAATAVLLAAPGVNTGGSISMEYSRTRWPRAQLTSTRSVAMGSDTASEECTWMTVWPSLVRMGCNVTVPRKLG